MGPGLQLIGAIFLIFLPGNLWRQFKLTRMSLLHDIQITIFRYCVTLQSDGWASWQYYGYCACRYDVSPIRGKGQCHWAFELPKISEAVHAGRDDRQPPCGAFWLRSGISTVRPYRDNGSRWVLGISARFGKSKIYTISCSASFAFQFQITTLYRQLLPNTPDTRRF